MYSLAFAAEEYVRSFAGNSDRASVNRMLFRYFTNYILSKSWCLIMMSWI